MLADLWSRAKAAPLVAAAAVLWLIAVAVVMGLYGALPIVVTARQR
jgi:hypothetical protein